MQGCDRSIAKTGNRWHLSQNGRIEISRTLLTSRYKDIGTSSLSKLHMPADRNVAQLVLKSKISTAIREYSFCLKLNLESQLSVIIKYKQNSKSLYF